MSVFLTILAAVALHICVRYMAGVWRYVFSAVVCALLAAAVVVHTAAGANLWAAIYILCSVFMLVCIAMPWLDLGWRKLRAG